MAVKTFCFFVLMLFFKSSEAQQNFADSFNIRKQLINKRGMAVLGSWAIANIAYGGFARSGAAGSIKYFHEMNMIWGGINLGLSAFGYIGSRKREMLNTASTLQKQAAVEKTFLFNAGLDVAYVAGGFYLTERAKNDLAKHERLKGYGNSIVLQGAALLLFDGVMYLIHSRHGKKLYEKGGNWQLAVVGSGVGVVMKF